MNEEKKLDLLNDHYKDTFSNIKEYLKQRDNFFYITLIILVLFLFQLYSPKDFGDSLSSFILTKLSIQNKINLAFLNTLLWFVLLVITIKYYQILVYIERQYNYLHSLEDNISCSFDNKAFTREGKSYLDNYPMFLNLISFFYTIFYPSCFILVITIKIAYETCSFNHFELLKIINIIIYLFIFIFTGFYLHMIHKNKNN